MIQENIRLKEDLIAAKKYIHELEIIRDKYMKNIDYEIKLISSDMSEGSGKDDFTKMMLKMMIK